MEGGFEVTVKSKVEWKSRRDDAATHYISLTIALGTFSSCTGPHTRRDRLTHEAHTKALHPRRSTSTEVYRSTEADQTDPEG